MMSAARIHYDPKDNIIDLDVSGVVITPAVVNDVFDRLLRIVRSTYEKPWLITCWAGVELDLESARRYGLRSEELKPLVVGILRYDVPDHSKVQIRSEMIKHRLTTKRSVFYRTRAEAVAAIRDGSASNS
jgi:hypothetical protein